MTTRETLIAQTHRLSAEIVSLLGAPFNVDDMERRYLQLLDTLKELGGEGPDIADALEYLDSCMPTEHLAEYMQRRIYDAFPLPQPINPRACPPPRLDAAVPQDEPTTVEMHVSVDLARPGTSDVTVHATWSPDRFRPNFSGK